MHRGEGGPAEVAEATAQYTNLISRRALLGLPQIKLEAAESYELQAPPGLHIPEFSRRSILKGLGAAGVVVLSGGVAALTQEVSGNPEVMALDNLAGDACAVVDPSCFTAGSQMPAETVPAPAEAAVPITSAVPETMLPSATTTTTAVPPTTVMPPLFATSEAAVIESPTVAEHRKFPYEVFRDNAELMLANIPTLETLNQMFPGTVFFHYVQEQKDHIAMLNETVQLDPAEYHDYHRYYYDMSRVGAFSASLMEPKMLIWHWTGAHYDAPENIISGLGSRGLGVQAYIHHDLRTYQFTEDFRMAVDHSLGISDFSVGLEVYTGFYDEIRSPVFNFITDRTRFAAYTAVRILREMHTPVNFMTLMSHFAADLIFVNDSYDAMTGQFGPSPSIRKFDQPREFMEMIVPKAMALDVALGPHA